MIILNILYSIIIVTLIYLLYTAKIYNKKLKKINIDSFDSVLITRTLSLVLDQNDRNPTHNGEYKRHQVYAQLLKDFPQIDNLDISMCIDHVLKNLKNKVQ